MILSRVKILQVFIFLTTISTYTRGESENFTYLSIASTEEVSEMYKDFSTSTIATFEERELNHLPKDCSQREKLIIQPKRNENSQLKKCCPIGEGLNLLRGNDSKNLCDSVESNFVATELIINAVLYDSCVEDLQISVELPVEVGNPCNMSLLFNNEDDLFYVLQDGSLLVMDSYANDTYTVEHKYCLDMDSISGSIFAIICLTSVEESLERTEIVAISVLMLLSPPCLFLISYLHVQIKELRTLHGLSLCCMATCLAFGYILHSIAYISKLNSFSLNYSVLFFILSYFFWFFCLCCNLLLEVYFKTQMEESIKSKKYMYFLANCFVSFGGPLILVILTARKGLSGMPSYFIQCITESIRDSQRYFIPPVSGILLLSLLIIALIYFGITKLQKAIDNKHVDYTYSQMIARSDQLRYASINTEARMIYMLGASIVITWLLEVTTFYLPGSQTYLVLMEIITSLQGVLILFIFVMARRKTIMNFSWWYDRGTYRLESVELSQ